MKCDIDANFPRRIDSERKQNSSLFPGGKFGGTDEKSVQDLFFTSTKITCSMLSHKSSFYAYSLTSFLHPDYYASIARANGDGAIPSPRYYEQPTPHANALNHPHHTLRLTKHQSATTTYLRAKGATRYSRINNGN